jgi:Cof subfamily protein (haloacid dehalogenase superfamily)
MPDVEVRLVVIDLDGTLLRGPEGKVHPAEAAAIAEAMRRGVTVALATGRPHRSAERFVAPLGLGETPIISFNGAMIRKPSASQPMLHLPLPLEILPEVLQMAVERRWHLHYFVGDEVYTPRMSHWAWQYQRHTGLRLTPVGDLRRLADQAPTKIIIMQPPAQARGLAAELSQRWQGRLYVTISQPEMVELMHPEANKGAALRWLARHLGIPIAATMAVGDSFNDAPLLEAAGLALAMPHAPAELAAHADLVLEPAEAPLAVALERFVLAGRA